MLKSCKLRSPCKCGSTDGLITHGVKPHLAKLVCWECGKFLKWLKQSDYQKAKRTGLVNSLADIEVIASSP
jgi:hypothetical protein